MRKVGAIAIATYGKQQDVIAYRPPKYSVSVFGVAELGNGTTKNTGGESKMISGILMGNWNISKF
ncbi:MAG: hypothetical protein JGK17_32355 [Microcoleus sp. PH2017_10_PVI_O_A]|uniref:hypothetical protein n=1 Tax=unclassified Microcoleus TaxID=2642155 RepID=UPI001E13BCE6|nr:MULTISPECIES: hypothetical protein [unclassified Microcoleus]MCC3410141.1 hypothetical protein [Microcoleus sp. PH2017_10_PVI_O_A]MCC3464414.1 hypothetical protein [Microcoleus sp. PH2017_11_PCY_U_A]MCC3482743.1 hypothetical protein [Microcoleus sp. PH2017_12_PCY_D_A]MCC3532580.1 hypothetical protein [Microcoleus sp. PH2017_21_RUC_O_A]MCC3563716.1 hypothetical protein [Microcoleus sp. PH2017_27_LUM_O_A]